MAKAPTTAPATVTVEQTGSPIRRIGKQRQTLVGLGLNKILGTIHIYPTLAEANKYAAGAWKRSQVTPGQTSFLAAFHAWARASGSFAGVLGKLPALIAGKPPVPDAPAHHQVGDAK